MSMSEFDAQTPAKNGAFLHLVGRHGDEIFDKKGEPVGITLKGSDCDEYKSFERKNFKKITKKKNKNQEFELDEFTDSQRDVLARMTVSWNGIEGEDGTPKECTYENALKLYKSERFAVIFEQVQAFVVDRTNF